MKKFTLICAILYALTVALPQITFAQGAGNALDLDGTNDCVNIVNFGITNTFTAEAWIKPDVTTGTDPYYYTVMASSVSYPASGYPIFIIVHGSELRVCAYQANPSIYIETSGAGLTTGTWFHIAVTATKNSTTKIYVNGIERGSGTAGTQDMSTILTIGDLRPDRGLCFNGTIDEVRIWNVVRTQTEIQEWMNKTNGLTSETGLVSVWHLDESAVGLGSVIDSKGSNNGTPTNMDNNDCVTSTAPIGDESHVGTGTSSLSENADVPVDISWDNDPGTNAIFSAIQINGTPDITTGLLANVANKYWEIFLVNNDAFQADVKFHYDGISGISDEAELKLYTRSNAGEAWSEVTGITINNEGNNTDGVGFITANDLTSFSQFIITSSDVEGNPLPVELLNFFANCKTQNTVELNWSTASEINNDFFTIERSQDAENFEIVKTVEGSGNSNEILKYSEIDDSPLNGISYYRLKQTDFNGDYTYSEIVAVENTSDNLSLKIQNIYSNPNSINFTVSNPNLENLSYELINILGEVLISSKVDYVIEKSKIVVNAEGLSHGIYFLKLNSDSQTILKKIFF
ncbi:MAG: T9SS type A sorting domain-containing protein [Saprospiraceae bacterium]|nr:T9SS type A sorting domain-containing protein [Saprospiraceae bacterium]